MAGAVACACALVCVGFMAHAVATDMRFRIISRWDCCGIAVAGSAAQLLCGGVGAWLEGAAFAVFSVAACCGASWLLGRKRQGAAPLGGGDVRCIAALSLATGPAASVGAAAAAAAATAAACVGMAAGRLRLSSAIPLAPALAVWLAAGFLVWFW
ncbi:hypothetical protein GMI70_04195 [Eggerthellaceae bacterium zg-893]|nr:hypothetical protein [Eggerthellaceae bacterium zg-893]